jgi:hypothetical protein
MNQLPMGLFDLFSSSAGLKRTIAKANNKDVQSVDRWKALEALRDDGSDEALVGLLRRFSFVYDKTIEDEQEKQWVHDALVELATADGGAQLPTLLTALEKNLAAADTIAWSLKVLSHIGTPEQRWAILEKTIERNDNQYTRDPSKKIQLIGFIGEELKEPRAAQALIQYLEDMDETVRFATVESLLDQKQEEVAREPLLKLLTSKGEESRRIKIRILDGLAEAGWNSHGYKGQVEELCQEIGRGHSLDGKGRIKKPAPK